MKAEMYEKIKPITLSRPVDIQPEFQLWDGHVFPNLQEGVRNFLHRYAYIDSKKPEFDEILKHQIDLIELGYLEGPGYDYYIFNNLQWHARFQDVWGADQRQIRERFVSFTAIFDQARGKSKAAELSSWIVRTADQEGLDISKFNNGIVHTFALRVGLSNFSVIEVEEIDFAAMGVTSPDFYNQEARISPDWAALLCKAFPPSDQNKENEVSEQQPQVEQSESTGKKMVYYSRNSLSLLLQDTADPSDLINVEKFIDEQVSAWSKHLALNTHKKQTDQTPRFSIHEGPGIVTILLDRSDLDFAERAPQLQMIFTDGENGLAITPRKQGSMTTTRMLDAFDQILLELNSGQRVAFRNVDSVVTFVEHLSNHTDSVAFREAIGDPKQAMILAGISDPDLTYWIYRMPKTSNKVVVEGHYNKQDGSEPSIIFTIYLDDVGHQGNLMLRIADDSPTMPKLVSNHAEAEELSKAEGTREELAPVWQEVRETPADPDSVLEKLPKETPETRLTEALREATKLRSFELSGTDEAMLKHVLARFRNEGNLSNADLIALDATENFIFAGGLSNVGEWEYEASLVTGKRSEEQFAMLRGDNNAYVLILATGRSVPVLMFQCQVNDEAQQ